MAKDTTAPASADTWRYVHGPRPIAALVPGVTRVAFRRAAPGTAQLMEAWSGIVGPTLADVTIPKRLAQGTLTVGCSGPVAMELQYLSGELMGRINQYLGGTPVKSLRFVQTTLSRPSPAPRPLPSTKAAMAADAAFAGLPEGPLRDALAGLGRAVHSESASRLGKQTRTRY